MPLTYRTGTEADSRAVFDIFLESMLDLGRRTGSMPITGGDDPRVIPQLWETRKPLFDHLARHADQFWVAERQGRPVGYARSIVRAGLRQLTEYFVLPEEQSAGAGRELIGRAFTAESRRRRAVVASTDLRAQSRYLKAGLFPHFPIFYFSRPAQNEPHAGDLSFEAVNLSRVVLESLAGIDRTVLDLRRDEDHEWLLANRAGYLYRRGGRVVGYGYLGPSAGPFAVLDPRDWAAVLAHAEAGAARSGGSFGVEVPTANREAVRFLLGRGFRLDSFFSLFMVDRPFGRFENYIFTSPPFFL